ncbi:hypothetical protein KJI95_02715 [Shewanella sp. JM162201]|uniref:Uncharacterized protein n=1 Tax=Shewanella jiangmenensis TaxID=2837387 RepID=A0ABS5UZ25_9GAMM|nr:hypothetical protein [Shewanella jiangmenensis]MBT1443436.1 hypothetical protein [Shewanella jiangmenensis]
MRAATASGFDESTRLRGCLPALLALLSQKNVPFFAASTHAVKSKSACCRITSKKNEKESLMHFW